MTFSKDGASVPKASKVDIAQKLDEVNRSFYARHAEAFADTRQHGWPGWRPLLALLPSRPLRVLDVGSGNGRLATFLSRQWCGEGGSVDLFVGLEQCDALLARSRAQPLSFDAEWRPWSWSSAVDADAESGAADASRDWVTLFGVLHHVFDYERRLRLLRWGAERVRPGGVLSISLWDFGAHPRWRDKRLDWARYAPAWGLDVARLEPDDTLLGWAGDETVPRYCHWVSPDEEARLVADVNALPGLSPGVSMGDSGDFNRYWSWRRP